MDQNLDNKITVEALLEDRKTSINSEFVRIMQFFANTNRPHLEAWKHNDKLYEKLGWNKAQHFDVINSFWTIYQCAVIVSCNYKYYTFDNNTPSLGHLKKETYAAKYLGIGTWKSDPKQLQTYADATVDKVETLETLAKLCHTVANFMPCPEEFNVPKMSAQLTQGEKTLRAFDFLPLMIDLIEKCYLLEEEKGYENNPLTYEVKVKKEDGTDVRKTVSIGFETVKNWHNYFSGTDEKSGDVRTKYCLEDYYYIYSDSNNAKHIKGIPLFEKQSLEYPLPRETIEVTQCLDEMVKRIKERAYRLYERQQQISK